MIFSTNNSNIAPQLVKSWAEIQSPKHNATVRVNTREGKSYTFDYTDLGGILDEAKEVFKKNEISVIQTAFTESFEGGKYVSVVTLLLHSSGEWVKSDPLQYPVANNIQDMGGHITYMKRYSLSAMLGISTEKDDDGNGASGNDYTHTGKQSTGPTAAVKSKYQLWRGSMDGFDDWYAKQSEKYQNPQIERFLMTQIEKAKS